MITISTAFLPVGQIKVIKILKAIVIIVIKNSYLGFSLIVDRIYFLILCNDAQSCGILFISHNLRHISRCIMKVILLRSLRRLKNRPSSNCGVIN